MDPRKLEQIRDVFLTALRRCRHCGLEQPIFWCDECQDDQLQFLECMILLIESMEKDGWKRLELALHCIDDSFNPR